MSRTHASWGGVTRVVRRGAAADLPVGMAKVSSRDPDRPQEEQEHCHAAHVAGKPVPPPLRPIRRRIVLPIAGLGAARLCRAAELQTITNSDHAFGILERGIARPDRG